MVKLTERSKVPQPVETRAVRPGEAVIVRNALPVGVEAASGTPASAGRPRMATVASVDQASPTVRLMDGSTIKVTPSTGMRIGTAGPTLLLTELRPGDELVIVMVDDGTPAAGTGAGAAPSALPRDVAAATPREVGELMVFREPQAP